MLEKKPRRWPIMARLTEQRAQAPDFRYGVSEPIIG